MGTGRRMLALLLVGCFSVIGCATTALVTRYPTASYPPTNPGEVQLYSFNFPSVKYAVIGEISYDDYGDESDVQKAMRAGAAKIGGDAVVVQAKETAANVQTIGETPIVFYKRQVRGVVVKFVK